MNRAAFVEGRSADRFRVSSHNRRIGGKSMLFSEEYADFLPIAHDLGRCVKIFHILIVGQTTHRNTERNHDRQRIGNKSFKSG